MTLSDLRKLSEPGGPTLPVPTLRRLAHELADLWEAAEAAYPLADAWADEYDREGARDTVKKLRAALQRLAEVKR